MMRRWMMGAVTALVIWACVAEVKAEVVLGRVVAAGDTLKVVLRWRLASGSADSVRLTGTATPARTNAPPSKTKFPPFVVGAWRTDTLVWVPAPVLAEGETVTLVGCLSGWRLGSATAPVCGLPFPYTKPVVPPVFELDSTKVFGMIAVPDSVSLAAVSRRVIVQVLDTMPAGIGGCTQPANGSTAGCYSDLAQTRCMLYLTHGSLPNPIRDTVFGVWRYAVNGVGYNRDGTPHPECAGYLPSLCVVGDMVDGRLLLTTEARVQPRCVANYHRPLPGQSPPKDRWVATDDAVTAQTDWSKWEQAVAHKAMYINQPVGWLAAGQPGYALAPAPGQPPYIVGLCGPLCTDTLTAPAGVVVPLTFMVRMSDGSRRTMGTPGVGVSWPSPGMATAIAATPWGTATMMVRVLPPLLRAS